MLAQACIELARRCTILTSVARTRRSLEKLDCAVRGAGCTHHMLALDWSSTAEYLDALGTHVRRIGSPSLALAWVHDEGLVPRIAAALAGGDGGPGAFFHVRSSTAADRSQALTAAMADAASYHEVILGFVPSAAGSRWLTNAEISSGVLAAVDRPAPVTVLGTVEPWHLRPRPSRTYD